MDDGIYYVPGPKAGTSWLVLFHDLAKRTSRQVAVLNVRPYYAGALAVSPDRRSILLSVATQQNTNVMVVENFR